MRCAECEPKPYSLARYCDCCGRELMPEQTPNQDPHHAAGQGDQKNQSSDLYDWAPNPNKTSDLRCPTCNGPSLNGNRCEACRQLAPVERAEAATPAIDQAKDTLKARVIEEIVSSASSTSHAPAQESVSSATPASAEPASALHESSPAGVANKRAPATAKASEPEGLRTHDSSPRRSTAADAVYAERMSRSAVASKRAPAPASPVAPAPAAEPSHKDQPVALIGTAVVLAVITAGAAWYQIHERPTVAQAQQLTAVAPADNTPSDVDDGGVRVAPAEQPAAFAPMQDRSAVAPKDRPVAATSVTPNPASVQAKDRPVASTPAPNRKPAPTASNDASAPGRSKQAPTQQAARRPATPVVNDRAARALSPARDVAVVPIRASAPATARPAVDIVSADSASITPAAAVGPFFELKDVSESPRIETRAEPRVPPALKGRTIKEVVIVRALVSQSGRPSRISLLRRTKAGPELDDAVLESVNRWTFSPARKKGEPVSCWFNFGVQVGGTD